MLLENEMIVLFDVDGVLIKAFEFGKRLKLYHSLTDNEINEFFKGPFSKCSEGIADLKHELKPFLKKWKLNYTVDDFCMIWFQLDGQRIHSGQALLNDCRKKGIKTGIATIQEKYRKQYILTNYPEIKSLDYHFFSCDIGYKKPKSEFFNYISKSLATKDILFIDDSPVNVEESKKCGWTGIHFNNQTRLSELI